MTRKYLKVTALLGVLGMTTSAYSAAISAAQEIQAIKDVKPGRPFAQTDVSDIIDFTPTTLSGGVVSAPVVTGLTYFANPTGSTVSAMASDGTKWQTFSVDLAAISYPISATSSFIIPVTVSNGGAADANRSLVIALTRTSGNITSAAALVSFFTGLTTKTFGTTASTVTATGAALAATGSAAVVTPALTTLASANAISGWAVSAAFITGAQAGAGPYTYGTASALTLDPVTATLGLTITPTGSSALAFAGSLALLPSTINVLSSVTTAIPVTLTTATGAILNLNVLPGGLSAASSKAAAIATGITTYLLPNTVTRLYYDSVIDNYNYMNSLPTSLTAVRAAAATTPSTDSVATLLAKRASDIVSSDLFAFNTADYVGGAQKFTPLAGDGTAATNTIGGFILGTTTTNDLSSVTYDMEIDSTTGAIYAVIQGKQTGASGRLKKFYCDLSSVITGSVVAFNSTASGTSINTLRFDSEDGESVFLRSYVAPGAGAIYNEISVAAVSASPVTLRPEFFALYLISAITSATAIKAQPLEVLLARASADTALNITALTSAASSAATAVVTSTAILPSKFPVASTDAYATDDGLVGSRVSKLGFVGIVPTTGYGYAFTSASHSGTTLTLTAQLASDAADHTTAVGGLLTFTGTVAASGLAANDVYTLTDGSGDTIVIQNINGSITTGPGVATQLTTTLATKCILGKTLAQLATLNASTAATAISSTVSTAARATTIMANVAFTPGKFPVASTDAYATDNGLIGSNVGTVLGFIGIVPTTGYGYVLTGAASFSGSTLTLPAKLVTTATDHTTVTGGALSFTGTITGVLVTGDVYTLTNSLGDVILLQNLKAATAVDGTAIATALTSSLSTTKCILGKTLAELAAL